MNSHFYLYFCLKIYLANPHIHPSKETSPYSTIYYSKNIENVTKITIFSMVANPDLKSRFQTESNPDLTKNFKSGFNPDFRFKSGLKADFGFQIRISDSKSGFDKKHNLNYF
jgi:hypothetical protein